MERDKSSSGRLISMHLTCSSILSSYQYKFMSTYIKNANVFLMVQA